MNKEYLMYNYHVYNNLFLYKCSTRLQSMDTHMAGWAAQVVSPFFFTLLENSPSADLCSVPITVGTVQTEICMQSHSPVLQSKSLRTMD